MSALTEVSEMDELKAAVANTGEPRLIALLERLAVVEGKLADGGGDLRAAIDAWPIVVGMLSPVPLGWSGCWSTSPAGEAPIAAVVYATPMLVCLLRRVRLRLGCLLREPWFSYGTRSSQSCSHSRC